MKTIIISILLLILFISGCDNSVGPTPPKTFGEITINSKIENFKTTGFSFSLGEKVVYPNSSNIIPDIIIMVQIDEIGNVLGVVFGSGVGLKPSFNLIHQASNIDSAQTFFNNLNEVPDSNYSDLAIPVKENQIWAVKSVEDNFGKILILNTDAYVDSSNSGGPTPYGEAKFKWVYQPDGSRIF